MKRSWLAMFVVVCVAIAGMLYVSEPVWHVHDKPVTTLRMGTLPHEDWQLQQQLYEPLLKYLETKTGLQFNLVRSDSYEHLLQQFTNHEVDLAKFGGLTFVRAHIQGDAEPLVMRDIDLVFTSMFIVPTDSKAQNLSDLEGKRLCFGSNNSTSGHLMPRHFMLREVPSIVPEQFFSEVCYSGAHDKTAYAVRSGRAEIGVANSAVIRKMFEDGRLKPDEVRILWETPPYADYVWAIHDHFAPEIKIKITNAFLELNEQDPVGEKILNNFSADYYLPARLGVFKNLEKIAKDLGLLGPGKTDQ